MFGKIWSILVVAVWLFLSIPVFSVAEDSDTSGVYKQCQDACAGNGLSCLNKCLAENRMATDAGNDSAVAVGEGQAVGSGEADGARERLANERESVEEGQLRQYGEPSERMGFRRR